MITLSSNLLILGSLGSIVLGWVMFILSVFLILLVLVQRGKGGGLTGALGGPGGQSAFGSKAGDTFTVITAVSAVIWGLVCAIAMYTLGVPPVTADDVDIEVDDTPVITSPAEPLGGLSGLSGLVPDEPTDEGESESTTGTPSMELTPAESTSEESDASDEESAEETPEESTADSDAAAPGSE